MTNEYRILWPIIKWYPNKYIVTLEFFLCRDWNETFTNTPRPKTDFQLLRFRILLGTAGSRAITTMPRHSSVSLSVEKYLLKKRFVFLFNFQVNPIWLKTTWIRMSFLILISTLQWQSYNRPQGYESFSRIMSHFGHPFCCGQFIMVTFEFNY